MRRGTRRTKTAVSGHLGMRSEYDAARESRFTRKRADAIGGSGDSHLKTDRDLVKMIERARELDRNTWFGKRVLDLAVGLEVGEQGPTYQPKTGDDGADRELSERWREYAGDPIAFDTQGRFDFPGQLEQVSRAVKRDGDVLVWLPEDGTVELIEADRIRSPANARPRKDGSRVVFGVFQDKTRRPLQYWVKPDSGPQQPQQIGAITKLPRFDRDGNQMASLVHDPDRVSLSRGVTGFRAIVDKQGMADDVEFAALVQSQMCSAFAMWRKLNSGADLQTGERNTETRDDGSELTTEAITPGTMINLEEGEDMDGFSPNIPAPQHFEHIKLIVQEMSATFYLPYVMLMMDASETNFSGWRAAVSEARNHVRRNRRRVLEVQYCRPVIENFVTFELARDQALRRQANRQRRPITPFAHEWKWPSWKSIQPKDDAQANAMRLGGLQASPREIAAEDGRDFMDRMQEFADDTTEVIAMFADRAAKLNEEKGLNLGWRDVAYFWADANKVAGQLTKPDAVSGNPASEVSDAA